MGPRPVALTGGTIYGLGCILASFAQDHSQLWLLVLGYGAIYGLMIVGWSLGGLIGPPLIAALIGPDEGYTRGYTVIGIIVLVALVLPMVTKMPRPKVGPPKGMPVDATGEAGDHVVK